jgi:putative ABC transport system substrate-binding protein
MQRRTFLGGSAAILAGPIFFPDAFAEQPPKLPLIGFLGIASTSFTGTPLTAFREGLQDRGFIEGENITIEYRWAGGDQGKLPALAAELVRLAPDVLVTAGGPLPAQAAQEATRTIPIIATSAAAAVENFARPGGNLTGSATQTSDLNPKRLEFLHEAVPAAALVGVLSNPANPGMPNLVKALEAAAQSLGIHLVTAGARDAGEFDKAFATIAQAGAGALLVMPDPYFYTRHPEIVARAARYKLPAIYEWAEIAQDGGLMAYGESVRALYHRVGDYAGRLLKGAKPGDLPLDQPAVIRLVINLKTAKALSFTFPPSILDRADEVIE